MGTAMILVLYKFTFEKYEFCQFARNFVSRLEILAPMYIQRVPNSCPTKSIKFDTTRVNIETAFSLLITSQAFQSYFYHNFRIYDFKIKLNTSYTCVIIITRVSSFKIHAET